MYQQIATVVVGTAMPAASLTGDVLQAHATLSRYDMEICAATSVAAGAFKLTTDSLVLSTVDRKESDKWIFVHSSNLMVERLPQMLVS